MNIQKIEISGMNNQNIGNSGMKIQNMINSGMNNQNMSNYRMYNQNMGNSEMNNQNMSNYGMNNQNMINSGMNMKNIEVNGMNNQNMGISGMNNQNMIYSGMNNQNMRYIGINNQNMINNRMNNQKMINIRMNNQNIENSRINNQNMGMNEMNIQNMVFPGMMGMQMNMNLEGINMGEEEEDWIYGYKITLDQNHINEKKNSLNSLPQTNNINCIFKTTQGVLTNISINPEKTINELIEIYLKKVGKYKLNMDYNDYNRFAFLYNANKIHLYDKTTVKNFFKNNINPIIIVNDIQNLLGALKKLMIKL